MSSPSGQNEKDSGADVPASSPNKGLIIALVVFVILTVLLVLGFVFRGRIQEKAKGVNDKIQGKLDALTGRDQLKEQLAQTAKQQARLLDEIGTLRAQTPAGQAELAQARAQRSELLEAAAARSRAESAAAGRQAVSSGLSQAASSVGSALSNVPGAGLVRGVRNWWGGNRDRVVNAAGEGAMAAGRAAGRARGAVGDWWARNTSDAAADAAVGFVPDAPAPQPGMMRYRAPSRPLSEAEVYGAVGDSALGAGGRLGRNIDSMGYEAYPGVQSLY